MTQEESAGILGISLVNDQLRVVEARLQENEFHITHLSQGRIRLPFNFELFEDKNNIPRLAEDLNRLFEAEKFEVKNVAFSLDSQMVMVKKLPVDTALDTERVEEQINWEVRQFLISPVKEYVVDFEKLNSEHANGVGDMLVVVVRKKIIQFLRQVFKQTNLKLKVVDVDVFSAQRALQLNYDYEADDVIALVEVEENKIYFSVLKGRNFYLTQEAYTPVQKNGVLDTEESVVRLIAKELRRIIIDHQLGKRVEDLKEIFLYGEAVEDGILEGLQNNYDVHIDRANPFRKVKLTMGEPGQGLPERVERFTVSVGAALRGIQ